MHQVIKLLRDEGISLSIALKSVLKGKGKAVPVLNKAPCHEDILGEQRYRSTHS
jgi:hypothetical protein